MMAQLLVRNLDEEIVRRLEMRAAAAGRSAEAEHRRILKEALMPDHAAFIERARQLRERTVGRPMVDSTEIIREFRDRGNPYATDGDEPAC